MRRAISNNLRPSARDCLGLSFLFFVALVFIAAGGNDIYRTGFRFYTLKRLAGKSQVAKGIVVEAEHPWFAITMSRFGAWKWYRIRYDFEIPGGQVVQGEDWFYRSSRPPPSLLIAYLPADPAANRIYTSNNIYDEHESWGQGVVGGIAVLVGGFFLVVLFDVVKMWLEIGRKN